MKVLLAIKSCARDAENGFNDAIRDTWLRGLTGANYVFVLGRGARHTKPDELILPCPDDYYGLPYKTKSLLQWSVGQDFDYTFLCDTDTYVHTPRLLHSGFANSDYVGWFNGPVGINRAVYGRCYAWASGGSGYWLSKQAAKLVADADPMGPGKFQLPQCICPELKIPCEDLWVGQVLGPEIEAQHLSAFHDTRYYRGFNLDYKVDISAHYCSAGHNRSFDPEWMYKHHEVNR